MSRCDNKIERWSIKIAIRIFTRTQKYDYIGFWNDLLRQLTHVHRRKIMTQKKWLLWTEGFSHSVKNSPESVLIHLNLGEFRNDRITSIDKITLDPRTIQFKEDEWLSLIHSMKWNNIVIFMAAKKRRREIMKSDFALSMAVNYLISMPFATPHNSYYIQ